MSSLERGLKSPTLKKLEEICEVLDIHPLALMALAYAEDDISQIDRILKQVHQELQEIDDA